MLKFQPTARALSHALKEELIERCVFKRESFKGKLLFTGAHVVQGLTYKGDQFLGREGDVPRPTVFVHAINDKVGIGYRCRRTSGCVGAMAHRLAK